MSRRRISSLRWWHRRLPGCRRRCRARCLRRRVKCRRERLRLWNRNLNRYSATWRGGRSWRRGREVSQTEDRAEKSCWLSGGRWRRLLLLRCSGRGCGLVLRCLYLRKCRRHIGWSCLSLHFRWHRCRKGARRNFRQCRLHNR